MFRFWDIAKKGIKKLIPNNVILHYEGALAVPNALHLAIQAYQKLGQNKMAAKYQKMLNESYPAVAS